MKRSNGKKHVFPGLLSKLFSHVGALRVCLNMTQDSPAVDCSVIFYLMSSEFLAPFYYECWSCLLTWTTPTKTSMPQHAKYDQINIRIMG